jgi:hypothetical protein
MVDKWRPEGFVNPYEKIEHPDERQLGLDYGFDEGADDLLEALRETGIKVKKDFNGDTQLNFNGHPLIPAHNNRGTLVFIPDDQMVEK